MLQYNPSISGSLNITGSLIISNGMIGTVNGVDVQIFSSSINQVITGIQAATGSQEGRLGSIESFTSSTSARLNSIETISASNLSRINSIETITSSNVARLNSIETITASNVARLNSLEIKTGSLATTGSNTFIGTQTITGSLFISSDLIVQGSSSLQNITASAVSIGTNLVNLNTANPAIRYAGLSIGDSGSIGSSGSFLYDSVQDEMIFVHRGANTTVTSSVVLMGPQTFDNIGSETYPTSNLIQKGTGNEHLVDSCIFDNGTTTCIKNNLVGTGTACFGGTICTTTISATACINIGTDVSLGSRLSIQSPNDQAGITMFNTFDCNKWSLRTGTTGINNKGFGIVDDICNTTRIQIDSIGRVGIGALMPCARLHIQGTSDGQDLLYFCTGGSVNTKFVYNIQSGADDALTLRRNHTTQGNLCIMSWTYNGYVGINCTTPSYVLDVNGRTRLNGNVGVRVAPSSAGDQYLTTGDAGIAYSNSYFGTGQVRIGGGSDHASNTVFSVAPGVVTFDRPGIGGGAFKIDGSGNVSVNNATGTAKFHAYGTTKLENYFYYGSAQSFVWQSVFNNPVQSLFTFNAAAAYSQTLIKVTFIQNGVSNGYAARYVGYALAHLNPYTFNSSVTSMTAEYTNGPAAPTLSWSGQTLQITPQRATNYDGYVVFIEWGSNTNTNALPTVTM